MAILDSKGRLFGKISLLDIAAGLIMLMVVVGLFLLPGGSGSSVAQIGTTTKPVEIDVIVRGLTVSNPQGLITALQQEKKTNIIIRNQPFGEVDVLNVKSLPRSVAVPQPDGTVKPLPDPRPELEYTVDMMVTLGGQAQVLADGPVLGGSKIKVGTPMELEGQTYRFNAPVVGVRILDQKAQ
ncbi:MAG: DUF4330 domain-containing protein [Synechococcales cyanobacterium C42_A2020_086]|jgi:hypothetical protein|nr:DUF4330 domain-containing protein [Synechococcales cyanobacterium M58_A2018_015]MBF2076838.1 DUF4330 domain-containing protein [Synechococcales cyanobacterium C42_A2020_086]